MTDLNNAGEKIGTLEKQGQAWVWTLYEKGEPTGCGWKWTPGEARAQFDKVNNMKGEN